VTDSDQPGQPDRPDPTREYRAVTGGSDNLPPVPPRVEIHVRRDRTLYWLAALGLLLVAAVVFLAILVGHAISG
jgi:hypothetical protein